CSRKCGVAPIVYPGTPEQTRFGESGTGQVALVTLTRAGARPTVTPLKVGRWTWRDESVTSLESLRRLASEDLLTTVLRLRLDMRPDSWSSFQLARVSSSQHCSDWRSLDTCTPQSSSTISLCTVTASASAGSASACA